MPNDCVVSGPNSTGILEPRGIIRDAALRTLCRYRHNVFWNKKIKEERIYLLALAQTTEDIQGLVDHRYHPRIGIETSLGNDHIRKLNCQINI